MSVTPCINRTMINMKSFEQLAENPTGHRLSPGTAGKLNLLKICNMNKFLFPSPCRDALHQLLANHLPTT